MKPSFLKFIKNLHLWGELKDEFPMNEYIDFAKLKLPLLIGAIMIPFVEIIEKYFFDKWEFLFFLFILIMLDTITGVIKHFKMNSISSRGFGAFATKVIVYGIFLIVAHILTNYSDSEVARTAFGWVGELCYGALIVRESISIIENLGAIHPSLIPSWILQKLKQFDESGKFKQNSDI